MTAITSRGQRLWEVSLSFFEHAAAVFLGIVLIVVGLALGVTMIMLPVGVVVGLIGVALLVGGLFARFGASDKTAT
jgi:membrane-bound ClpP family serine protease